ncbi:hypothetical protein DY000_02051074 [Brassica cretica]|uniref:PPM-type phosphatase domain-containing protein n=1 Tax=Brassica cretica TaxID=69181 RepID=A0ABQ7F8F0_BRACR|nr:hypothetical protein DY000_02051074 [Brassica cretica]
MAIPRFSSLLRWRKLAKSDWLVASIGFVLFVFFLSFFFDPTSDSVPSVDRSPPIASPPDLVKLTLSSKAKERGACTTCLVREKRVSLLVPVQLNMEHSTNVQEEVRRIRNEHSDDPLAIESGRVKGYLKVTRAFGAGFLKQVCTFI